MFAGKYHNMVGRAIQAMEAGHLSGVWVGGGAFRSFVGNEPLNDIDMFFDSDATHRRWVEHMLQMGASRDAEYPDQLFHYLGCKFDHSVTKRLPTADAFIDWADYTVSAGVIDTKLRLTSNPSHVSDILNKELKFWKGWTPLQGLERGFKLLNRGYRPPLGTDAFFKELHARCQTMPIERFAPR